MGVGPRRLAPRSLSRAHFTHVLVDFRKEKEKENLRTSSGSSEEFQGCFGDVLFWGGGGGGGIAEFSAFCALVHSWRK